MCGVVELNAKGAFCQQRYVAHGFIKQHAKTGELLDTGPHRGVWSPARYRSASFDNPQANSTAHGVSDVVSNDG
jgi:hypothetical protein